MGRGRTARGASPAELAKSRQRAGVQPIDREPFGKDDRPGAIHVIRPFANLVTAGETHAGRSADAFPTRAATKLGNLRNCTHALVASPRARGVCGSAGG